MASPQPFYEIYLALGLVALLWVILRVNLAGLISRRMHRLVFARPGQPSFLQVLSSVCRVMFSVAVLTASVVCFWPLAASLMLARRI